MVCGDSKSPGSLGWEIHQTTLLPTTGATRTLAPHLPGPPGGCGVPEKRCVLATGFRQSHLQMARKKQTHKRGPGARNGVAQLSLSELPKRGGVPRKEVPLLPGAL